MVAEINIPIECAKLGCNVIRKTVNNWFVVEQTGSGAHIHRWHDCPDVAMLNGKHVCGLEHAFYCASAMMTPDNTDANRESTMVLAPPLTRDGEHIPPPTPVAVVEETECENEETK
jgi:hypothetical protein